MFNDITPLISGQVPEHLRFDSPLFAEFLKTYYAYASQRNKAIGVIQNHSLNNDIDYCEEQYITNFYNTYGKHIPAQLAYDRRNFVKLLNSIYNAKGTEKALKLIFQAVFGESVDVSYPGDQILKASDGIWVRENFITLVTEYGTIPANNSTFFSFSNSSGDYNFESSKIEELDSTTNRIYFKSYFNLQFVDNQFVYHYDTYGVLLYIGKLVYSPSRLLISNGGKDWVKGQAIIFPGSIKNTVAKVLTTDANGGITSLEILEYGYFHSAGQTAGITPYRTKPITPTTTLTSMMVSFSPLAYNHELTIHDYVNSLDEVVTITHTSAISGISTNIQNNVSVPSQENADVLGLSLDDWYASRAVFVLEYDRVVSTKGYYENSQGQISNQNIKMQDNYYYQAFSYLLETARDVREYSDLLNITHPAGLKRFSKLSKSTDFLLTVDVMRTLSVDTIYLLSVYTAIDTLVKNLDKQLVDSITLDETIAKSLNRTITELVSLSEIYANHLTKYFTETVTSSDTYFKDIGKSVTEVVAITDIDTLDFTKPLSDQIGAIDAIILLYEKNILDSVSVTDAFLQNYLKNIVETVTVTDTLNNTTTKPLTDSVTITELFSNQPIKYFIDTVTVAHLETTSVTNITYAAENYFAESYTPNSYTLTIG